VTWTPLTDHTKFSSIGAIAVAPSNHNIIYIGTGEAAPRGDMTYGNGVFKSVDAGKTWESLGLQDTRQIGALVIDPEEPRHRSGRRSRTCVRSQFRTRRLSHDRRRQELDQGPCPRTTTLRRDRRYSSIRTIPRSLCKPLWQARRLPWNFSSGGPGSGLYRSIDGGATWTQLTGNGLPAGILGRIDISVSGANSKRVYAMVEAKDGGLYRSEDGGAITGS
jgi:hypothetical protein